MLNAKNKLIHNTLFLLILMFNDAYVCEVEGHMLQYFGINSPVIHQSHLTEASQIRQMPTWPEL